jgi:hypothetical protein
MQDNKLKIDAAYIAGNIAYQFHNGGHKDTPDWRVFFSLLQKILKTLNQNK